MSSHRTSRTLRTPWYVRLQSFSAPKRLSRVMQRHTVARACPPWMPPSSASRFPLSSLNSKSSIAAHFRSRSLSVSVNVASRYLGKCGADLAETDKERRRRGRERGEKGKRRLAGNDVGSQPKEQATPDALSVASGVAAFRNRHLGDKGPPRQRRDEALREPSRSQRQGCCRPRRDQCPPWG